MGIQWRRRSTSGNGRDLGFNRKIPAECRGSSIGYISPAVRKCVERALGNKRRVLPDYFCHVSFLLFYEQSLSCSPPPSLLPCMPFDEMTTATVHFIKGGIRGRIYGAPDIANGKLIETTQIVSGEVQEDNVVGTVSGKYYLLGPELRKTMISGAGEERDKQVSFDDTTQVVRIASQRWS